MNTKEAIEFCDEIDDMINAVEHLSDNSRSEICRNFISLRKLLKRGEKFEKNQIALVKEIEKRQQKINELEKYKIMWFENKYYSKSKKIEELEKKYFPKPSDNFTEKVMEKINKEGGNQ